LHNTWLNELRGYTYNSKLIDKAFKYLLEEKLRALNYRPIFSPIALIVCHMNKEVLSLGGSTPSDLVLDNFGTWLAAFFRAEVTANKINIPLVEKGGTTRNIAVYGRAATGEIHFNYYPYSVGTKIQIGSSTVAPTRGDYAIGTAFTVAPESELNDTGHGSYAAGGVTFSTSITAGGSGTINESGVFGRWHDQTASSTRYDFMLFHDSISPGVSFSAGQSITIQYSISL